MGIPPFHDHVLNLFYRKLFQYFCSFITGGSRIAATGLMYPIESQPDEKTACLPKTQACFSKLMLPTCHSGKEEFFGAMVGCGLKSFDYSSKYSVQKKETDRNDTRYILGAH